MAKARNKLPAAASVKSQPKKPNPFELKKTKTKFNVIGRRTKGQVKNVVQARQDAHNKRKATLLVEYKALRKANTFKDRRLGEAGGDMTEDDRALARLQALRVKQDRQARKTKGASKFVLSEADEGGDGGGGMHLTHMGKSLSEIEDLAEAPPNLNDLDDDMVADLVATYNFGGGEEDAGAGGARKTRKQIMEEIIAKSKAYKALKAKQKEEDENELDKLNDEFRALVSKHSLKALMKPVGYMKGIKVVPDDAGDAAYDQAARSLAAEARGAAGERTLTPEEMEERERVRLEALEKERLRRMRGIGGDDDDGVEAAGFEAGGGPKGGYAARRKKRKDGDSGDDSEDDEGEDDGEYEGEGEDGDDGEGEDDEDDLVAAVNQLEARRRQQAAGDHPLQDQFRDQAAALLSKYGVDARNRLVKHKPTDMESDGDDEGEEDEGEDDEGEEGEEEESGDEMGDGESGEGAELEEGESGEGESGEGEVGEGEEESEEEEQQAATANRVAKPPAKVLEAVKTVTPGVEPSAPPKAKHIRLELPPPSSAPAPTTAPTTTDKSKAQPSLALDDGPLDLPYTIPMPSSYQQFSRLVSGRPAEHLVLAVRRIRAFNAPSLAAEAKKQLQVFYGMLVQHFAMLAGQSPLPQEHLDVVLALLLPMTGEVPFYSATVARARLQKMHERLNTALSAAQQPANQPTIQPTQSAKGAKAKHPAHTPAKVPESPWPNPRTFLQLNLFTTLFPVSDRRHPVVTPLSLLVSKYLSQCTATSAEETAMGVLLCGIALRVAEAGRRFIPELLNFLTDALLAALPTDVKQQQKGNAASSQQQSGEDELTGTGGGLPKVSKGLLVLSKVAGDKSKVADVSPPDLTELLGRLNASQQSTEQQQQPTTFVAALLHVVLVTAGRAARSVVASCGPAAPAALAPLMSALSALGQVKCLSGALEERRSSLLLELESSCQSIIRHRTAMVQTSRTQAPVVKEYNPRFEEEGFVLGRDYDPDRVRAEQKKLKRQLQKEKRGAIRELRRDAVFLAAHRDKEKAVVDAERMESQKRFYSELQSQEADMKSGGQAGMNPHLKKKKGNR